ncbi:hypothetical protein HD806DRAFT_503311 [Xylariaceae sp. AK1471]|nr:hypothetical protein HD806DRAFT_503311 [Xylariaceae sp. AK1471]
MDYAMRQAACDRRTGSRNGRFGGRSDRLIDISLGRTMIVVGFGSRSLRRQPLEFPLLSRVVSGILVDTLIRSRNPATVDMPTYS